MFTKIKKIAVILFLLVSTIILVACGSLEHKISFNTGLGSDIDPIVDHVGSIVIAPTNPTKEGHTFLGWDLDGVRVTFPLMLNRDKVLVAVWEEIPVTPQFTLSFNTGLGSDIEPITDYFGTTLSAPGIPTKEGFNFIGWNLDGARITFPLILNRDKVLVAVWEAIELTPRFTISFNTGLGSDIDPITNYVSSTIHAPARPDREGFEFVGWELNGVRVIFPLLLNRDMVFVAIWEPIAITPSFTVSFNTGLGSDIDPITDYMGVILIAPTIPTRDDGFGFAGWTLDGITVAFPLMLNRDKVLVAIWEPIAITPKVTISFETGLGSDVDEITNYVGSIVAGPINPTKEGYMFVGWDLNGVRVTFPLILNIEKTLEAIWQPIAITPRVTISFNTGLGSSVDEVTDYVGSIVAGPISPTKDGYIFVGWDKDGVRVGFPLIIKRDAELVAVWHPSAVGVAIVTLDANEGVLYGPTQIVTRVGQAVQAPTIIPVRNGHTFDGWFHQGNEFNFETLISGDIVLYANWIEGTPGLIYVIIDEQAIITGFEGNSNYIKIPSTINGYPVVGIESGAFAGIPIRYLILPETIKVIGESAFAWNSTLTYIALNEGLQSIGDGAFTGSGITEIVIPSTLIFWGSGAFTWNTSLTSVTLSEGLQTIGYSAFAETSIVSIEIPSSIVSICDRAFYWNISLTSVILNEGLQSIGQFAFWGTGINEVFIPKTVFSIGTNAFPLGTTILLDSIWADINRDGTLRQAMSNTSTISPLNAPTWYSPVRDVIDLTSGSFFRMGFDWPSAIASGIADYVGDFSRIVTAGQPADGVSTFPIDMLGTTFFLDDASAFPRAMTNWAVADNPTLSNGGILNQDLSRTTRDSVWQLEMRRDLFWVDHSGEIARQITAADLVFSIRQYINPLLNNTNADLIRGGLNLVNAYEYSRGWTSFWNVGVWQVSEFVVEFHLNSAQTQWQFMENLNRINLIHEETFIASLSYGGTITDYGTIDRIPYSNGRFIISNWIVDEQFSFIRNEHHHDAAFTTFAEIIGIIIESAAIVDEFILGNIDFIGSLNSLFWTQFENDPRVRFFSSSQFMWFQFSLGAPYGSDRERSPLLLDPEFRQAMFLAIDRFELANVFGPSLPNLGHTSSIARMSDYTTEFWQQSDQFRKTLIDRNLSPDTYGFDPVRARAMFEDIVMRLEASGEVAPGAAIPFTFTYAYSERNQKLADWLGTSLEGIFGPRFIFIQEHLTTDFWELRDSGDFDLIFLGLTGGANITMFLMKHYFDGSYLTPVGFDYLWDIEVTVDLGILYNLIIATPEHKRLTGDAEILAAVNTVGIFVGTIGELLAIHAGSLRFSTYWGGRTETENNIAAALKGVLLDEMPIIPALSALGFGVYQDHISLMLPNRHSFMGWGGLRYKYVRV